MIKSENRPCLLRSKILTWANQRQESSTISSALRNCVRIIIITLAEFKKNNLSLRSSALTYTILLSLVPMLAMSTAIVKGLGGGDQLRTVAITYIESLESTPSPAENTPAKLENTGDASKTSSKTLTEHLRSAVDQLFNYVDKTNFATLGTVGVFGILLSIILVLSHIESAMNTIWKVNAGRSLLRKIADYLTLLILLPLSINVAFAASAFLKNPALSSKINAMIPFLWLQTLLFRALPVFFIALTFYVIYIFFPNTKVKTMPALIGASFAAIIWFGVQNLYISLQLGVANYNAIYGSFATLPLFLVWMYLCWIFILAGAQIAYACQNVINYQLVDLEQTPSQKLAATFDIIEVIYDSFEQKQRITKGNINTRLPQYPKTLLDETIEALHTVNVIHTSLTDKRLLPTLPARQLNNGELVNLVLGSGVPDSGGGEKSRRILDAATRALAADNSNGSSPAQSHLTK